MTRALVVVNPRAGRGRAADLSGAFLRHGLPARFETTSRPGHASELAALARRDGLELVVAAGGDGTVHEVVNGLLSADGPMPALGVLPMGSGCDYAKTFSIPADLEAAVAHIADAQPRPVDAGRITYASGEGERTRYFANIAEVGIGGAVVARAARLPRFLGPAMYGVAFAMVLPVFRRHDATVRTGSDVYQGPLTDLVVAIGRVFGGGMRVAPGADPSDGLLDVQVHRGTKIDYVRGLPKVYKGTHLPHPRIDELRASRLEVTCDPPGSIEADGEVLGFTPATFEVLPGALRLRA